MRSCKVCSHVEVCFIDRLLAAGISPRAISRRIGGGADRLNLTKHRDHCLAAKLEEEQRGKEEA